MIDPPHIGDLHVLQLEVFVGRKQRNLEESHHEQLDGGRASQQSAHRDEHGGDGNVRPNHRLQAQVNVAIFQLKHSPHDHRELDEHGAQEKIKARRTVRVLLQEGHEEPKTNKDHHVDVLKVWKSGGE